MSTWRIGAGLVVLALGAFTSQEHDEVQRNPLSLAASEYVEHPLRGFDVRVDPALTQDGDQADTGRRALDALDRDLADVLDRLPESAHSFLRSVPIYLGVADPVAACACYHVSAKWLDRAGFDPAKAKAVEIASALTYLAWREAQPSMVMHELSHAYHDQVLGKPHAGLTAALQRARASGRFDRVVRFMGNVDRHYALTNADEYFAETTEALFGVNDFFPFVRGELMAVDPEGAALVTELWKAPPPKMASELSELKTLAKDEIARLHRFFVDWFGGDLPATDEAFSALDAALDARFEMIIPTGDIRTRKQLTDLLRAAHGKREVAIETRMLDARVLDGVRILATYEELSTEGENTHAIISTVLFERDPAAPGGLRWLHVHETERQE